MTARGFQMSARGSKMKPRGSKMGARRLKTVCLGLRVFKKNMNLPTSIECWKHELTHAWVKSCRPPGSDPLTLITFFLLTKWICNHCAGRGWLGDKKKPLSEGRWATRWLYDQTRLVVNALGVFARRADCILAR